MSLSRLEKLFTKRIVQTRRVGGSWKVSIFDTERMGKRGKSRTVLMRPTRPKKSGMFNDFPSWAAELVVRFRVIV